MKRIVFIATLICFCCTLHSQNNTSGAYTEVKGKLKQVTVYPSSALIEKTVKINLVKGNNKFIITDNATTFSKDNLHFTRNDDFFITSVNINTAKKSFNQKAKEIFPQNVYNQIIVLQDKRDKTQEKIDNNKILLNAFNQQLNALNNLKAVSNTQTIDTVNILRQQFDFQRDEVLKISNLINKCKKENEQLAFDLVNQQQELENFIKKHNGNCNLTTKSNDIIVNIYSNKNMTAELEYNYLVSSVMSNYSYDVLLEENSSLAVFNLKTNVQQSTNENWKDCNIIFSTNQAGWAGSDEELYTWYLNNTPQYSVQKNRMYKSAMMTNNAVTAKDAVYEMAVDDDVIGSELMLNGTVVVSSASSTQNLSLGKEYTLNTEQSIASNDKPQTIPLLYDTTKVCFKHFSTPKAIEKVYYTALLPDWEDLGLQNTNCDIFLNGKYIAKSYINTDSTKDTMKFSAGEDVGVKIARKIRKSSPDKGFLSSNVEETVTVTLNIKNTKKQNVDIEIKDQIPISQNADIKITNVDKGEGNLNSGTGIIKWNLNLKSGEIKEVKFSYTVKYPKDFHLNLN